MTDAERPVETRPAGPEDDDFLFGLFSEARERVLRSSGLPAALVATLLRSQYAGQRLTYRTNFPDAEHQILLSEGQDVGAGIVDRPGDQIRIVDIVISSGHGRQGLGSRWMRDRLREAAAAGLPVRLDVAITNAGARALYDQLGFAVVGSTPTDLQMEWVAQ